MDVNQLAQILVQRGGYNPTDAANAAKGPRAQELAREFGISQPSQQPSGVTTAPQTTSQPVDINAIARQMQQLQTEAAQPAIKTLEAGRQPLKERYDTLLKSIKERGAYETGQADIVSARELGRRGIPTESTFAGQFQQEKRLPVQTAFGGLEAQTGLSAEEAQNAISSAVAQLQAGGGQNAIQQALQQYQFGEQQRLSSETSAATLAQQVAQAQAEQAFKEKTFQQVTLPESIYGRNKPYFEPKTTTGSEDESAAIQSIFGIKPQTNAFGSPYSLPGQSTQQSNPLDLFWKK